ncbi:unnamed protein product [Rotaria sp. Silwood1]|nr:unnamed protein product [Rotaria sp. Silwood1]
MNLFIIILSLILFHEYYIYGLDAEELNGIDVLTQLKNTSPNCDLGDFLRNRNESKLLHDDLSKYCSLSDAEKQYRILCHMLSCELEIGCRLSTERRPSKALYAIQTSSKQICGKAKIQMTNKWIWNKITNDGQKQIGVESNALCPKVTSDTDVLRLARFFYQIAPLIRTADLSKTNKAKLHSNTNNVLKESPSQDIKNTKETIVNEAQTDKEKTQQSSRINTKKTDDAIDGLKEKTSQIAQEQKDKTGQAAEEQKDKAGEDKKEKTAQTGEGTKDKADESAKDKTSEGTKEKNIQTGEGTKEKTVQIGEGTKEKTVQTGEDAKDKTSEGTKEKTAQTGEGAKDKADEGIKEKSIQVGEGTKEKTSQVAEESKDKAGEGAKEKTAQTGDGTKVKADEGTKEKTVQASEESKDKAGEDKKEKTTQTGEGTKDKTDEGTKEKTIQTDEGKKDKTDDGTKEKTAPTGEGTKDKTDEGTKEKTVQTDEGKKDKTDDGTKEKTAPTGEGKKDKTDEGTKEKTVQTGEGKKDKTDEGTKEKTAQTDEGIKDKVNIGSNVVSNTTNKTGDQSQGGTEKAKQSGEESVVNKTSEELKLRKNATNELSPNTGEKTQQVLDLNKDKKTEPESKKSQENTDNTDNDEDNNNDKQSENNEPVGQIPKPDLSSKKDQEKAIDKTKDVGVTTENKTSNLANEGDDKLASNKNNESGNDFLSLTNLMKQYNISLAELIKLIKNNKLNLAENRTDSSISKTTSADPLIERKKDNTLGLPTSTFSTLRTASSSSAKIYSLEINRPDKEKNKDKETNDADEVKPNDRTDDQDEDELKKDEEAENQLKKQQEDADKDDFQAVDENKGKPDNELKSQDDDGTDNDPDQQIEKGNPSINDEDAEYQGTNVGPNGMKIKKPTDEDKTQSVEKSPEKNIKTPDFESSKSRIKPVPSRKYDDNDGWSGSFVTYFLIFTLFVVVGYLVLHNKNKLMAYVVEGRRSGASRTGSRPSHRGYEKLKNVNDIIPLDDTNPLSDKEAIILKT